MTDNKVCVVVDTNLPMHALKTKKAYRRVASWTALELISTAPSSKPDITVLINRQNRLGHELLKTNEEGRAVEFHIKIK